MSRVENFINQIKTILPGERRREQEKYEREQGKILADRFDTIKPQLKELDVAVHNSGNVDLHDHKWISFIELSFNIKNRDKVLDLLTGASIQEIDDPGKMTKFETIELLERMGSSDDHLIEEYNKDEILIYTGKYLNQEDRDRLLTLEPIIAISQP